MAGIGVAPLGGGLCHAPNLRLVHAVRRVFGTLPRKGPLAQPDVAGAVVDLWPLLVILEAALVAFTARQLATLNGEKTHGTAPTAAGGDDAGLFHRTRGSWPDTSIRCALSA